MSLNCAQRILYNGINAARTAALVASSVLPAERASRTVPALREGSAGLALSGAYTGAADATFDVRVVDTTPTTPIISRPLLAGVGNGTLSAIAFAGAAQSFTLELVDAGSPELFAKVAFANTFITARAAGAAGNGVTLTVDASGLTYTPLNFSTIAPLPKDTRRSGAVALDFDAVVMNADNLMPATAKRIIFGNDKNTIYRQAKQWTGSGWEYVFEPPIARYIAQGERVSEVTGTYEVTVEQGATTEVFAGIKTVYDLLVKLNTLSALVRVDGVIANDRGQGGQAASEMMLRTDAYAMPSQGNGSQAAQGSQLIDVSVAPAAPTEVVELHCWAVTARDSVTAYLGGELWTAKASVSGDLGNVRTGDLITMPNGTQFRIPQVVPQGYGDPRGEFSVISIEMPRSGATEPPPVCMVSMALGPDAVDQTVQLIYTKRPSNDCRCDDMPAPDLSQDVCLLGANNPNTTGASSVSYPAAIQTRMTNLWAWYRDLAAEYSQDHVLRPDLGGVMDERSRLSTARQVAALFEKTAIKVAADSAALADWDTAFDDAKAHFKGPADAALTAQAAETIAAGSYVNVVGGKIYLATAVGSLSTADPFISYVTGYSAGAVSSGASVAVSTLAFPANGIMVTSGLTAGARYVIDPTTPGALAVHTNAGAVIAGFFGDALSSTLLRIDSDQADGQSLPWNVVIERFSSAMDAVLAKAHISPLGKSDASSVGDDGCWQDLENEQYYWRVVGGVRGNYLPAFTNVPYYSSRRVAGAAVATHEFAFQINVNEACVGQLKVGDTVNLAIGGAAWPSTYQVGDAFYLPIVAAAPLTTAGGQDGSPDQVWHVNGSVDGAFAPFTATAGSGSYSDGGLAFTLTQGGIAFDKGDRWTFSAEGGHWQWRKNGGAWSASIDIGTAPVALSDGLSATFSPGAAPSFVANDLYSFAQRQPNAPGNLQAPTPFAWRWSGSSATLDVDFGVATAIDTIAIARHAIALTAGLTVQGGTTVGASNVFAPIALTVQADTIAHLFETAVSPRWLRFTLTGAAGGAIGWLFAGMACTPTRVGGFDRRRDYRMNRSGGLNPSARYLGAGLSGSISWPEGALEESDAAAISALLDYVKAQGDEPIIFFHNASRASESTLGVVDTDSVRIDEVMRYQPGADAVRYYSTTLPLSGIKR